MSMPTPSFSGTFLSLSMKVFPTPAYRRGTTALCIRIAFYVFNLFLSSQQLPTPASPPSLRASPKIREAYTELFGARRTSPPHLPTCAAALVIWKFSAPHDRCCLNGVRRTRFTNSPNILLKTPCGGRRNATYAVLTFLCTISARYTSTL